MSKEKTETGLNFTALLGLAFIVLKLTKVIDWSWWWVTAPLWGGLALILSILLFIVVVRVIIGKH